MSINIKATGCAFARVVIKDLNNNITYLIKVCVLNMLPKYLEEIQTCYLLDVPKNIKRGTIQAIGLNKKLTINPGCEAETTVAMKPNGEYVCNYNQTLLLSLDEEDMDSVVFAKFNNAVKRVKCRRGFGRNKHCSEMMME